MANLRGLSQRDNLYQQLRDARASPPGHSEIGRKVGRPLRGRLT
jgi:hypothetical protein